MKKIAILSFAAMLILASVSAMADDMSGAAQTQDTTQSSTTMTAPAATGDSSSMSGAQTQDMGQPADQGTQTTQPDTQSGTSSN